MKKRVRVYKAQMGGVAAAQEAQTGQPQIDDQAIVNAALAMLQSGKSSDDILNELVNQGVDQEKAVQVLSGIESYISDQNELAATEDTDVQEDLEAEQMSLEQEAEEERLRQQQLTELYGYDTGAYDEGEADEDYGYVENVLMRSGGTPSKRTFMRNTLKDMKAQEGMQMQKNKADFTDTGARTEQLNKFIGTIKGEADQALMKKDAEAMYDMLLPEAQFGMNMSPRQQRRFNRRINRLIGENQFPLMSSGFHSPFPTAYGISDFMVPAYGSYQGGPRLANIDVRRTGLFGKPKEYTITFAQEAITNPKLRESVYRLEESNVEQKVKDIEEAKQEKVETQTPVVASNGNVKRESSNQIRQQIIPEQVIPQPEVFVPPVNPTVGNTKSIYANQYTPQDMLYYNPDKPGFMYFYNNDNLFYDEDFDPSNPQWIPIKDKKRIEYLNERLRGADLFTLDANPGYYYRMRPDGSFSKFKGQPEKHSESAKQISVIKPGDKNFNFLKNNAKYSTSYQGIKRQEGGFVDPFGAPLQKFIYGGADYAALPETKGKLTDSPYFKHGGLHKAQEGENQEEVCTVDENGMTNCFPSAEQQKRNQEELERQQAEYRRTNSNVSYSPMVFPGGYAKQKGLPFNPVTGQKYYGAYDPYTMSSNLSAIDVTKTRLSGAPKKYTFYFGNYDPTAPIITDPKVANAAKMEPADERYSRVKDVATTVFNPIRRTVTNTLSGYGNEEGSFSRLKDFGTSVTAPMQRAWYNKLQPRLQNVADKFRKEDGGSLYEAQMAGQSPFLNDPRFAPVYTDNPEFMGMSDVDLITSNAGALVTDAVNTGYDWQNLSDIDQTKLRTDQGTDPKLYEIDPNQPTRPNLKRNKLKDPWAVSFKAKRSNEENINNLLKFNAAADWTLSQLGERGQRDRMRQMYNQLLSDNLYGSTGIQDRGTYDTNSGLFRPDQMGFKGVVRDGGMVNYQEGGEAYMSEDQIKKFLEEGGELEFI